MDEEVLDLEWARVRVPSGLARIVANGCVGRNLEGGVELLFFRDLPDSYDKEVVGRVVMDDGALAGVTAMMRNLNRGSSPA